MRSVADTRTEVVAEPVHNGASDDQLAFQLFSVLSGLAALVLFSERAFVNEVHGGIPVIVPVLFAVAMAWKPSNVWLALRFWGTYTCYLLFGFPRNNTNQTLLFFVGVGVLASAAVCMVEQRSVRLSGDVLYRKFNPLLRICVFVLYAWTFWDKLNYDFLSPQVSCATTLTMDLLSRFGLHPSAQPVATPAVVMTVLIEGALPIGLLFSRTQRLTVLLGFGFHWLLGLAGYYGFSSTMVSLLTLFAFPVAGRAFSGYDGPSVIGSLRRSTLNRLALAAYLFLILFAKYGLQNKGWVGAGVWFGVPFDAAVLWWNNRAPIGEPLFGPDAKPAVWRLLAHPKPLYLIALLVFLNGASPWLGYKTEYSFAMYSNLRTEGGKTNHLIWGTPLALANYQTDLVYVLDGSDKALVDSSGGRPVPRYALSQRLRAIVANQQRSGIVLVLGEGTEVRKIEAAERDAELMAQPTFLESRLLSFRQIVQAGAGECAH